jgi:peptidyl-dipeptidase A
MVPRILIAVLIAAAAACTAARNGDEAASNADAAQFIGEVEKRLEQLNVNAARAAFVQETHITPDTEALAARTQEELTAAVTELALAARKYDGQPMADDVRRKLMLLKLQLVAPAPNNDAERAELTKITVSLNSDYGRGKYCRRPARPDRVSRSTNPARAKDEDCLDINALSNILADSRDPKELLDVWQGWHKVGAPMRDRYRRFVELSNKGARELGFEDTGAMWRSNYDMAPDQFSAELERLWTQVQPLYVSLHAYVRSKLTAKYGPSIVPPDGPIPAHLLGNMWAQQWSNIYPLVAVPDAGGRGYDLTAILRARKTDEQEMVRYGERFFTSLGFPALPQTFWERSLFRKPADREVVCHASAWNIDAKEDVRLKMCVQINGEDFVTVHHELGHDYYTLAYNKQPVLFQAGANDGFHEAIGDAIALSTTPGYLKEIGLLDRVPGREGDLEYLMKMALDKVAFLPFGLLIDQWRWRVFSGDTPPSDYNKTWWELRRRYQGVSEPLPRSEQDFDPGAKYHVPANTPYSRYFLAAILQFQFHRALCKEAGHTGPLHTCSIYDNDAAGAKMRKMLEMGASRPWPDALAAITGQKEMDATAILDYFAPLRTWLDDQNQKSGVKIGW